MVEGVTDDGILLTEDSLEETCVGIEATREQDAIFNFVVVSDHSLQLLVDVLGAADEPH